MKTTSIVTLKTHARKFQPVLSSRTSLWVTHDPQAGFGHTHTPPPRNVSSTFLSSKTILARPTPSKWQRSCREVRHGHVCSQARGVFSHLQAIPALEASVRGGIRAPPFLFPPYSKAAHVHWHQPGVRVIWPNMVKSSGISSGGAEKKRRCSAKIQVTKINALEVSVFKAVWNNEIQNWKLILCKLRILPILFLNYKLFLLDLMSRQHITVADWIQPY